MKCGHLYGCSSVGNAMMARENARGDQQCEEKSMGKRRVGILYIIRSAIGNLQSRPLSRRPYFALYCYHLGR